MIVGIDLGTTNSLIAYFTENGPVIIPNRLGKNLTPSVVSIDENNQVYVGETAKERELLMPGSSASVFKRDMGSNKKFKLLDKEYMAEDLSSLVLRALKEDAESFLGEEVTEAVISVPAYFNDQRRRATKRAGELAGLKVDRIISEPTAAAIAYGLYQNRDSAKFLVFDLGGGTFDVSILEMEDSIVEVRAVAGDNYLGGEDFTNVMEKLFYEAHQEIEQEHLSEKTKRYIHKQADNAKIDLATNNKTVMHCVIDDKEVDFTIDYQTYDKACQELLDRIRQPVKRSLNDAGIKVADIDKVVLVGGATKHPIIRRFVGKMFGMVADTSINPDEAIALGAAIQGAMKQRNEAIREVILTDVCSFTLGTEVVVGKGEQWYERGHFLPIIERNTTIPASRTERLYTASDDQTQIRVNILQGESRFADNNMSLGELYIDIPRAKAGEEAVDVTYTYDVNSILEVIVKSVSTDKEVKQIIKGRDNDMTDEEIAERFKMLSYLKIHPRDKEENKLLLLKGERLYEGSLSDERNLIDVKLREFEKALSTQDTATINRARDEFREFLEQFE